MTQDQFYIWMETPSLMNGASIPEIREVLKRYPYFQAAQVMLAKNLKQENHIDQLNQLQLAAVMVPDRKLFHDYLHDKIKRKELVEELVEEIVEEPIPEKVEKGLIEEAPAQVKEIQRDSLYDLIPEPIVYQLETAELPDLILPVETKKAEALPEPESLTFSEWLDFVEKEDLQGKATPTRVESIDPQPVRSNIDIIDHFLTQQSSSPKKRAEFFNPQKVAAKSTVEDFTVISETLARIYFEQEKYELARQAYESLSLNYPEKSIYFAARLKEIDEKLNSA